MKHPIPPMSGRVDYLVLKRGDNLFWDGDIGDFQPYNPGTYGSNFVSIEDDGGAGSGTALKCFTRHALIDPSIPLFVFGMQFADKDVSQLPDPLNDVCVGSYYLPGNSSKIVLY